MSKNEDEIRELLEGFIEESPFKKAIELLQETQSEALDFAFNSLRATISNLNEFQDLQLKSISENYHQQVQIP